MSCVSPNCRHLYQSTYNHDYKNFDARNRQEIYQPDQHTDRLLINGECKNNLHSDGKPIPYELCNYPLGGDTHENYEDYVKKIAESDEFIFNRFFSDGINPALLFNLLNEKTIYSWSYSPLFYKPLKKPVKPLAQIADTFLKGVKVYPTSYARSFNLPLDIPPDKRKLSKIEVPIFCREQVKTKMGKPEYYSQYIVPALYKTNQWKNEGRYKEGFIDRHTCRKI